MKTWHFLFLLIIFSCGKISPKGEIVAKHISVEDFNSLNLNGKFRVFLAGSDSSFVNVETYPNFADNLKINVEANVLNISEKREVSGVDFYTVTVYAKNPLRRISVADSVEVNVSGALNNPQIEIELKDQAKFIGALNTDFAEIKMKNLSKANFTGFSKKSAMQIADTASVIAPYFQIGTLDLDFKNGGYAEVNVKDSIKGNVRNTAKLLYYNAPIRAFNSDKSATVNNKKLD